jgi:hypothetical protein
VCPIDIDRPEMQEERTDILRQVQEENIGRRIYSSVACVEIERRAKGDVQWASKKRSMFYSEQSISIDVDDTE